MSKNIPVYRIGELPYGANKDGEIYSSLSNRYRKDVKGKDGYHRVLLSLPGGPKTCYVHRLVWEAHNGPIPPGMTVNHKDLNKSNNRLDNLELMTQADNLAHARSLRKKWGGRPKGKPVRSKTIFGKVVKAYQSLKEAGEDVGADPSNILKAIKDPNKQCRKLYWEYV